MKRFFKQKSTLLGKNTEETGSSLTLRPCLSPDLEIRNSLRDHGWLWEGRQPSLSKRFHPELAFRV